MVLVINSLRHFGIIFNHSVSTWVFWWFEVKKVQVLHSAELGVNDVSLLTGKTTLNGNSRCLACGKIRRREFSLSPLAMSCSRVASFPNQVGLRRAARYSHPPDLPLLSYYQQQCRDDFIKAYPAQLLCKRHPK